MNENEKYLRAYFGRNADYYLEKYRAFYAGRRFTFNIAPFFMGGLWFLYRKLWSESIIIILFMILTGMLEQRLYPRFGVTAEQQTTIMLVSTVILGIVFGFVGNYCYLAQAEKTIHKIVSLTPDEAERVTFLSAIGGISWIPFALIGVVLVMIAFGSGAPAS
jgi:hypothetical protein